ncbi:hypothetical protein HC766_01755 [Candidatus Gracilibacteria bacterium]|nr:hypothetical protein [Candidatus Gracilibacteria bacterium]NJS41093.1 hypothetical protein [Candidatus Gracilibacteria bacterium]
MKINNFVDLVSQVLKPRMMLVFLLLSSFVISSLNTHAADDVWMNVGGRAEYLGFGDYSFEI